MHTPPAQPERMHALILSIESLWIARTTQDSLEIALADPRLMEPLQPDRHHALRLNRDVFERLGIYGCTPQRVDPWSIDWTAASRVELIRQVAVHWRSLIDTAFGTPVSGHLIQALSEDEVIVLDHIQRFSHALPCNHASVVHGMSLQMQAMAKQQDIQQAQRRFTYLRSIVNRI